jgi:hypothetical protein
VLVCTNGESVELFLNGRSLGAKPGRFVSRWDVPYASGVLRAVAQCGNVAVEHSLSTAGDPAALKIESSADTLMADGADAAEITITVVDEEGNPALTEDGHAVFRAEGPAAVRGIAGIPCTPVLAGVGRIVVQASSQPGTVIVRAAYRGLTEAALTLQIV